MSHQLKMKYTLGTQVPVQEDLRHEFKVAQYAAHMMVDVAAM